MGIYLDGKVVKVVENEAADKAAREAAEKWRTEHADDAAVESTHDERGFFTRTETVVVDAPTFKIIAMSDGTIRKDNRQPPAPKPEPVTVDSKYRYTTADLARLASKDRVLVEVTAKGMKVIETEKTQSSSNWLNGTPRSEFGDDYKRP